MEKVRKKKMKKEKKSEKVKEDLQEESEILIEDADFPKNDEQSENAEEDDADQFEDEGNYSDGNEEEIDEEDEDEEEEKKRLYEEALAYREAKERRGVVYMSRVPPFMKPNKARSILEEYGEVTRLYLAEENPEHRRKRKEHGGNASKQFREGWIEFADKKIAKRVAESLNNTPMGGKKGDYYHDDLWNLKYLKNFKWEYLTEKFAYEKRIRESKLRAALKQSKKEVEEMRDLIEKSEIEEQIQNRKRNRSQTSNETQNDKFENNEDDRLKKTRKFRQEQPIAMEYDDSEKKIKSNVLKKIFQK